MTVKDIITYTKAQIEVVHQNQERLLSLKKDAKDDATKDSINDAYYAECNKEGIYQTYLMMPEMSDRD